MLPPVHPANLLSTPSIGIYWLIWHLLLKETKAHRCHSSLLRGKKKKKKAHPDWSTWHFSLLASPEPFFMFCLLTPLNLTPSRMAFFFSHPRALLAPSIKGPLALWVISSLHFICRRNRAPWIANSSISLTPHGRADSLTPSLRCQVVLELTRCSLPHRLIIGYRQPLVTWRRN